MRLCGDFWGHAPRPESVHGGFTVCSQDDHISAKFLSGAHNLLGGVTSLNLPGNLDVFIQ